MRRAPPCSQLRAAGFGDGDEIGAAPGEALLAETLKIAMRLVSRSTFSLPVPISAQCQA